MRGSLLAYSLWACAALLWLGVQIADAAGFRINHTPSLPVGLWRVAPLTGPLQRGQIVSYCPPNTAIIGLARQRGYLGRGACPGGHEPMLKRVYAIGGDRVRLGYHWGHGERQAHPWQPLAALRRAGPANGESAVQDRAAGTPGSFDSRYFGPVPESVILGSAKFLF